MPPMTAPIKAPSIPSGEAVCLVIRSCFSKQSEHNISISSSNKYTFNGLL